VAVSVCRSIHPNVFVAFKYLVLAKLVTFLHKKGGVCYVITELATRLDSAQAQLPKKTELPLCGSASVS
jgi:hypothetical protein